MRSWSILFVCHGNICRSPMAEYVMKDLAARAGLSAFFRIGSAGVSSEEEGNPVYPPARQILLRHGIPCPLRQARKITPVEYGQWDLFPAMDESNLRRMIRIFGGDPENKCRLLLGDREVADPWYTGGFDETWNDVLEGCTSLLETLKTAEE